MWSCGNWHQHWERLQTSSSFLDCQFQHGLGMQRKRLPLSSNTFSTQVSLPCSYLQTYHVLCISIKYYCPSPISHLAEYKAFSIVLLPLSNLLNLLCNIQHQVSVSPSHLQSHRKNTIFKTCSVTHSASSFSASLPPLKQREEHSI